jgi:hypothetical protein
VLVKISTLLRWPIERQIPSALQSDGWRFVLNDRIERCDAWVVYQGLYRPDETECPPNRVFLFTYEPPGLHDYAPGFLDQFAQVVTCHKALEHPGRVLRHQAQPWLAGLAREVQANVHAADVVHYDWNDLAELPPPEKCARASAICTSRKDVPGHLARLQFIEALHARTDCSVDLYGYGHRPIADKLDALLPYDFHVVLENSSIDDYWTEKLADAYLAYCLPLVWGCSNLTRYFPRESFVALDTTDPQRATAQVAAAISAGIAPRQRAAVAEARRLILEDYNLFAEIRRLCVATPAEPARRIQLDDEFLCRGGDWLRAVARLVKDRLNSERYAYYMTGGWRRTRRRVAAPGGRVTVR